MLNATALVNRYTKALEMLTTGEYDDRDTYVHDYDSRRYREDPEYTLNGLHWGYPDSIVQQLTGEGEGGYASWVTSETKSPNSRFSIVKYREIKSIVELGIRQKLDKAQEAATAETAFLLEWDTFRREKYSQYLAAAIRIDQTEPNTIDLILIRPERLVVHGMGSFLEDIKKGDVSISLKALAALESVPARKGLNIIEFMAPAKGIMIAGFLEPIMNAVPLSQISVWPGFTDKLREIATVTGYLPETSPTEDSKKALREQALAKLSPEEREVLGL